MSYKSILAVAGIAAVFAVGVFAQRVGNTYTLDGQTYTVESVSGDRVTLRKAPTLDGVWNEVGAWSRGITIDGNTGVFTQFGSNALVLDAVNKGYIKIGDQYLRNLTKTGDLTWNGQELGVDGRGNAATGVSWRNNVTITLNADGQSFEMRAGSIRITFRRQ